MEYCNKLVSESTYFFDLRCQAVRELIVKFGDVNLKFLG